MQEAPYQAQRELGIVWKRNALFSLFMMRFNLFFKTSRNQGKGIGFLGL